LRPREPQSLGVVIPISCDVDPKAGKADPPVAPLGTLQSSTWPVACELIRQTALGLDHAQQHGLVHRNIKPSKLMLNKDGQVKILDLGLAMVQPVPFGGRFPTKVSKPSCFAWRSVRRPPGPAKRKARCTSIVN
jgi:serine/threonine protein kinase